MDRSLGTVAQPRIQNVTDQILKTHTIYGASDNTNPAYASANCSLNYAEGGSITRPQRDKVSIIPFKMKYNDAVGLFGKENHFIRVDVKIDGSVALACFEEEGWECAQFGPDDVNTGDSYISAVIDRNADLDSDGIYDPANVNDNVLLSLENAYVSVDLNNLKTGNKYIDSWFDVRLYTRNRMEHPYDKMYVRLKDYFYIGFHARNTKRLPYNVECVIGQKYVSGIPAGEERYENN